MQRGMVIAKRRGDYKNDVRLQRGWGYYKEEKLLQMKGMFTKIRTITKIGLITKMRVITMRTGEYKEEG